MLRPRQRIQAIAIGVACLPLIGLGVAALRDDLGANPIETLTHVTGEWALRWLLVSLAVTPARRWLDWQWAAPLRRTFGLAAFGYASLHLGVWAGLDWFFDLGAMWEDVVERRYITMGFAGFLCMLPLAITSTRGWIRRLGKRWVTLHRLAYLAGIAAVVHYLWLVKADLLAPLVHAALLASLFGLRWLGHRRSRA
ncbi:MAG: protein-methionine-sulfoxide reductase heme-binding subunit MsrQ [Myxococcota bacterium]